MKITEIHWPSSVIIVIIIVLLLEAVENSLSAMCGIKKKCLESRGLVCSQELIYLAHSYVIPEVHCWSSLVVPGSS